MNFRTNFNQQFDTGTSNNFTFNTDDIPITTIELPDPLIDWLPYKIEKYIPTWHLVRSYKK